MFCVLAGSKVTQRHRGEFTLICLPLSSSTLASAMLATTTAEFLDLWRKSDCSTSLQGKTTYGAWLGTVKISKVIERSFPNHKAKTLKTIFVILTVSLYKHGAFLLAQKEKLT